MRKIFVKNNYTGSESPIPLKRYLSSIQYKPIHIHDTGIDFLSYKILNGGMPSLEKMTANTLSVAEYPFRAKGNNMIKTNYTFSFFYKNNKNLIHGELDLIGVGKDGRPFIIEVKTGGSFAKAKKQVGKARFLARCPGFKNANNGKFSEFLSAIKIL